MKSKLRDPHVYTEFIIIRHAETKWTPERRYTGSTDVSLSAKGRKQARRTAAYLKKIKADFLYCSALKRSVQTAAFISKNLKKKIRTDKRFNEISFGTWEGKTADELIKTGDKAFAKWCSGKPAVPKGGESRENLRRRVSAAVRQLHKRHEHKRIVIVSHGGAIRMILLKLLSLPSKYFWAFQIDPASVTVVRFYEKSAQIVRLNHKP